MKNSILKSVTNNIGYKILAFAFAFTLWLIVYNIDDPMKTRSLTINVTVTNASYLQEMEKYYEIIDGTNRVTFSVNAPRSVWEKLDETDFSAVANMNNINIDETESIGTVPIEITCKENSDSIKITEAAKYCKVALENLKSKNFVVTANAVGTVADGHALGGVSVDAPTVIRVSGPESLVESIAGVVATIDVEGMSTDMTDNNVVPVLYDADGKEIDTTRLTFSHQVATVSAKILKTKDVPISVKPEGTPATGYVVTSITSTPSIVGIKGDSSLLNLVTAIEIPSGLIRINDAKEDLVANIDISSYLPDGTELLDKTQANIEIVVTIEPIKNKNYSINTKDIEVIGLAEGMEVEYANLSEAISVSGLKKDIDKLTVSAISASIDVTGLEPGTHQVILSLNLDDTKYIYTERLVTITISEIIIETETESESEETETDELPQQ